MFVRSLTSLSLLLPFESSSFLLSPLASFSPIISFFSFRTNFHLPIPPFQYKSSVSLLPLSLHSSSPISSRYQMERVVARCGSTVTSVWRIPSAVCLFVCDHAFSLFCFSVSAILFFERVSPLLMTLGWCTSSSMCVNLHAGQQHCKVFNEKYFLSLPFFPSLSFLCSFSARATTNVRNTMIAMHVLVM